MHSPRRSTRAAVVFCLVSAAVLVVSSATEANWAHARYSAPLADIDLPLTASWSYSSGSENAGLGATLAYVGDVNDDGYGDIVVGAPDYNDGIRYNVGRVDAFYGSALGFGETPSWSAVGGQDGEQLGSAVDWAGDVNGDGVSDVVIGAESYDTQLADVGRAYVYFGSQDGLAEQPSWTFQGGHDEGRFGHSVAGITDVNDDGVSDILVGAPGEDAGGHSGAGCAHVFFGSTLDQPTTPDWSACGDTSYLSHGETVAAIGDVNGDGKQDVAVRASFVRVDEDAHSRVTVYYGTSGGPAPVPSWSVMGDQPNSGFGEAIARAGDVNADGVVDFVMGAGTYEAEHRGQGAAFVYHGDLLGLGADPASSTTGEGEWAEFGLAVAHAEDFDHDGYADVVIGAPGHSGDVPRRGRVYIFRGSGLGVEPAPAWYAEGTRYDSDFGASIAVGDIDADGKFDVIVGAPHYDAGHRGEGAVFAYLGRGPSGRTFVVDSLDDSIAAIDTSQGDGVCATAAGTCTLRAAMLEANASEGADTINFSVSGEVMVATDMGSLPVVLDRLSIDASGVWDSGNDRPGVTINGGQGGYPGLTLAVDDCEVYGLYITGFDQHGIHVGSSGNTIGSPALGKRNVLSGNTQAGVALWTDSARTNLVQSNYIGLGPDGASKLPNRSGVLITAGAANNMVGGGEPGRGNVISGNQVGGVEVEATGADENSIFGNIIGLAADSTSPAGNGIGVSVAVGAGPTAVGAARESIEFTPGMPPGNILAGNEGPGLDIVGPGGPVWVSGNVIKDNGQSGVSINGRADCDISYNAIHGNLGDGLTVRGAIATGIPIRVNSIYSNAGSGIALLEGANGGIQPPTIASATYITASGTACADCWVELYSDLENEGRTMHVDVQADSEGKWGASGTFDGPFLTATNTNDLNNTSEFSAPFLIGQPVTATATATSDASPTPTAGASATPTQSPTPSVSATATSGPSPGATDTPTPSPATTVPPAETYTATPTPDVAITPTDTPSPGIVRYRVYAPILVNGVLPGGAWLRGR